MILAVKWISRMGAACAVLLTLQPTVLDSELEQTIRNRVRDREHYVIDVQNLRFVTQPSAIIPGLQYRWAEYSLFDAASAQHDYAVGGITATNARIVNTPEDWGALVGEWFPRSTQEAKSACVEMFRIVRHEIGPNAGAYLPYEGDPSELPSYLRSERRWIANRVHGRSQVRKISGLGRWQADIWVLTVRSRVVPRRVRCILPAKAFVRPEIYSLTVIDSIPPIRNKLAI